LEQKALHENAKNEYKKQLMEEEKENGLLSRGMSRLSLLGIACKF
jgi:hypothetical protein